MLRLLILVFLFGFILNSVVIAQDFADPRINSFGLEVQDVTQVLSPFFGDFDNDGDQDFFTTLTTRDFGIINKGFDYWENIGTLNDPSFARSVRDTFSLMLYPQFGESRSSFHFTGGTVGDLDDDGDLDIIANASYPPGFSIRFFYYENVGDVDNPMFEVPEVNPFGMVSADRTYVHKLVDMNNDGLLDILYLVSGEEVGVGIMENQGTKTSPNFQDLGLLSIESLNANVNADRITTADFDADGDIDILAGTRTNGGAYSYFENQGDNTFVETEAQPFGLPDPMGRCYPTFIDLDGDLDLDVFAAVEQSTPYLYDFYYYENITEISSSTISLFGEIIVYPSITDGLVYFNANQAINKVEIYTSNGLLVKKYNGVSDSINLGSYESGLYYVVFVGNGNKKYISKIVRL